MLRLEHDIFCLTPWQELNHPDLTEKSLAGTFSPAKKRQQEVLKIHAIFFLLSFYLPSGLFDSNFRTILA